MGYVEKVSKSITASCGDEGISVFYLGENIFSLGKIYSRAVYKNK